MPLEPGTTLGVYEVLSAIGAGGMGEVYKARDTKLDRDVALKILPDAFVNDAERLARFQREAKVLASLNHPNIAQIHGLEEGGDSPALVLEYVEGPTLQDRISQGPIPMDEALPIARQIAEALEAAHEQGIIHRDLKPANVKVRSDGTVKVLDFGLAKALQPELSDTEAANSPTMTAAATRAGIIMGTAAYMAPEQAKGRQVDKRADIWAFGVVLFEMLTGRQAFGGTDISETLAFVLTREIEWTALPTKTPASVRRMLRRCVARDRKNRLADMSMARLEIDEADAAPETPAVAVTTPVAPPALWQRPVFASAALVLALITGGLVVWSVAGGDQPAPRSAMRLSVALPPTVEVTGTHNRIALSGDGRVVVFNGSSEGTSQLYRRSLDQPDAVPIAGTEDAVAPFLSPDGEWVGFAVGHELKKVSLVGGPPLTICALDDAFRLASWGPDDTVVFGTEYSGLWQVSAAGGEPQELTTPDTEAGEIFHIAPSILPGGHTVLFWSAGSDGNRVELLQKDSGERRVLVEDGASPHYVTTGHVVFSRGDSLWATPFDLDELSVTGAPFLVLEGVQDLGTFGGTQFGVARDGTLVYVTGPYRVTAQRTLAWVDRKGNEEAIDVPPRAYTYARLSPGHLDLGPRPRNAPASHVRSWFESSPALGPGRLSYRVHGITGCG